MILTGECKEDFLKWCKCNEKWFNTYLDIFQNALIIEFFYEQEYKIEKEVYNLWDYCFVKCYWDRGFKEYKESVAQAIKKANDIYNERLK